MAFKEVPIQEFYERNTVEKDLNFVGLIIFSNPLKPDSRKYILELNHFNYSTSMISGDNPLTSISIGLESGISKTEKDFYLIDILDDGKT